MNYFCCTETRRDAILDHPSINGIDFLEVLDNASDPFEERQTVFYLHFLKPVIGGLFNAANFLITDGERIKDISVIEVTTQTAAFFPASPPEESEKVLVIKVDKVGDFSNYTLTLVDSGNNLLSPDGFDPLFSTIDFSFKVNCPNEFDCEPITVCITEPAKIPEINYLAKDYASFKQLMLDRMSLLMPDWIERNPADIGITLVELLAHIGDHLSYRQDAIATEAYLNTARKRISVRRHARLIDYFMHDGCNARAWVQFQVGPGVNGMPLRAEIDGERTKIISKVADLLPAIRIDSADFEKALRNEAMVFELMHDLNLHSNHNEMNFHTFGNKNCCLPKGATGATLSGDFPSLGPGSILILYEKINPETGLEKDANPLKRHPILLTKVEYATDYLAEPETVSSPPAEGLAITHIEWAQEDALPFPLCLSAITADGPISQMSVALGNIGLVDHGLTITDDSESSLEPFEVPEDKIKYAKGNNSSNDFCDSEPQESIPARFNPQLKYGPISQVVPIDFTELENAESAMNWSVRETKPAIRLMETDLEGETENWYPQKDLLSSTFNRNEFVVEIDEKGIAHLRFGNNVQSAKPDAGSKFKARYRLGNGISGNIGANLLNHIVINDPSIISAMPEGIATIWNPLAAKGGKRAETMEEVRQYAPEAFRTQERAVTTTDYENFALKCNSDIQKAAATYRWTGSWKTVFLTTDRFGGDDIDAEFETELRACMEKYRMAGIDLEVDGPIFISLEIEMTVCVKNSFFVNDVKRSILEKFSANTLADGQKGVFHPDNFSFGQTVYLSQLYAAAQAVEGVDSVRITKFGKQRNDSTQALDDGKILMGRREIARCDNDPNFPERGRFNLTMKGGR